MSAHINAHWFGSENVSARSVQNVLVMPANEKYPASEPAEGEFGVFLVGNRTNRPHCCKIRVQVHIDRKGA